MPTVSRTEQDKTEPTANQDQVPSEIPFCCGSVSFETQRCFWISLLENSISGMDLEFSAIEVAKLPEIAEIRHGKPREPFESNRVDR